MKIEEREFEVQVPKIDGSGTAEKVKVMVPVRWDAELKDWLMTPEGQEIIDNTKARLIDLMVPAQFKELRERYDYSQQEMGELFQVGEKSWTRWESGKHRPSRSINLLIRALYEGEISINYLLKRAGKPLKEDEAKGDALRIIVKAVLSRRHRLESVDVPTRQIWDLHSGHCSTSGRWEGYCQGSYFKILNAGRTGSSSKFDVESSSPKLGPIAPRFKWTEAA